MRRIEVRIKGLRDPNAHALLQELKSTFKINAKDVAVVRAYNIDAALPDSEMEKLGKELFADRVMEEYSFNAPFFPDRWRVEIGFLPGTTDNEGKTSSEGTEDLLGKEVDVFSTRVYAIDADLKSKELAEEIAYSLFANKVIQKVMVFPPGDNSFEPYIPKVVLKEDVKIEEISLNVGDEELLKISRERLLALSLQEMVAIKGYLDSEKTLNKRKWKKLGKKATDVELEALAQSWSEHCKHKIFNAKIQYEEENVEEIIDSIFQTYIAGATDKVRKPYVVSVFKDNGGIVKFDHEDNLAVKVETHNAPSALDPYGGALTGILGVNRDVLGTGLGAKPVANVNMLCFGYLDEKEVPEGALHPSRIAHGVVKGIEHGGNQVGIPTVNGSVVFEKCYTARPLVYAGTVGLMPDNINGRETAKKKIEPGYLAVMVGGKIGKDGIHGATFSSQQLTTGIGSSVVQIGDPITQKKVIDLVLEARDRGLYEAVTDNGAGGLSSSIGEMAQMSGGCKIHLEKAPLKYPGLKPWEILLSESQERMSLAVPKERWEELEKLAKKHDVEATVVGEFTDSGYFHVLYEGKSVAYLEMDFLHGGVPQMKLGAVWKKRLFTNPPELKEERNEILRKLLASPNIASKEWVIRQYDHEVQGGSAIKPLMGYDGPTDAGVVRPVLGNAEGIVIGHGICPKFIEDSYHMAMLALDEGVRNVLAVGGKFSYLACLDNFSWPDPIKSHKNQDGAYKLAQLVRAARGLHDAAVAYGIPIISGKDSMKNDYYVNGEKYSVNPTLLVTVVGKVSDVDKAISSDFKESGDVIYALGTTRKEMGGSEYYRLCGGTGSGMPEVKLEENIALYRALSNAIEKGLVRSCHDVSDGGLAVAFAECAIGGRTGAEMDLKEISRDTEEKTPLLFSESAGRFVVSVREQDSVNFETAMRGTAAKKAGRVRGDRRVLIRYGDEFVVNDDIGDLRAIWKRGITW